MYRGRVRVAESRFLRRKMPEHVTENDLFSALPVKLLK